MKNILKLLFKPFHNTYSNIHIITIQINIHTNNSIKISKNLKKFKKNNIL